MTKELLPILPDLNALRDRIHLPTRTIWLEGEISSGLADWLSRALHLMDINPRSPLTIYLTSPGGEAHAGLAMYDLIRSCKSVVRIIGYGEVCSAAVIIFSAADERLLMKHAKLMIHAGEINTGDSPSIEIVSRAKEYAKFIDRMFKIIGVQMGLTVGQMKTRYSRDSWFDARAAIRMGLADGIVR